MWLLLRTICVLLAHNIRNAHVLFAYTQGAMKQLLALRQYSAWVTPASGALLVAGGTYTLLSRLIPA